MPNDVTLNLSMDEGGEVDFFQDYAVLRKGERGKEWIVFSNCFFRGTPAPRVRLTLSSACSAVHVILRQRYPWLL